MCKTRGNWRCHRVSDLSHYHQAQIGAMEVRQWRMSRHGRSGRNCSSCTPTPWQFSFRAVVATWQNVLVNSRPSSGSRRLPTPGQVQHGQRHVATTSSQLLRRGTAWPNQAIDPDRSRVQHSERAQSVRAWAFLEALDLRGAKTQYALRKNAECWGLPTERWPLAQNGRLLP
jgi:hypothetical protein